MTEPVVDGLEVVEVDEHHRDTCARTTAAKARLIEPVEEQRTVREFREIVAEDALLELTRKLALHGHVAHRDHETRDIRIGEHVDDAHLEVAHRAVAIEER